MTTKTKNKRKWPWIFLSILMFFLVVTVGIAAMIYWIAKVYDNGSLVDKNFRKSIQGEELMAPGVAIDEMAFEYFGDESIDYQENATISTAVGETTEKRIIKIGSMKIEVVEIDVANSEIINIVQARDGFVQNSNLWIDSSGKQNSTITIKIPADKFEDTYTQIKRLAKNIESENISGKDVTEEYVDLQAQLKNYRAEEEQYLSILEKATTIDDILKVTKQLSIVRGSIEAIEGRLKYLDSLTNFSTITVYLSEGVKVELPTAKWRPLNNLKKAFSYWIQSLQWLADILIWLIIFIGPLVIFTWSVVWLIRKRKSSAKR